VRVIVSLGCEGVDNGRNIYFSCTVEALVDRPCFVTLILQKVDVRVLIKLSQNLKSRVEALDSLVNENRLSVKHFIIHFMAFIRV
jgi:hypothetical protein